MNADKKLTDNEIVKALEDTLHRIKGAERLIVPKFGVENLCNGLQNALDLINRIQAEKEALINGQETLQKYIAEQKAEIERLKEVNNSFTDIGKLYSEIKVEAYKECIERVKEYIDTHEHLSCEECECVPISKDGLDNLLKELVGEQK